MSFFIKDRRVRPRPNYPSRGTPFYTAGGFGEDFDDVGDEFTPSSHNLNSEPRPHSSYPWSIERLQFLPLQFLPSSNLSHPPLPNPSPSPFPRYGHALTAAAAPNGNLFLFGGLVGETDRNDLYSFSTRDTTFTLLQTAGDLPSGRVGHACALVSNVLIVWGGNAKDDLKSQSTDEQDNALYLLNLGASPHLDGVLFFSITCVEVTREWIRITAYGPTPVGRYGHTIAITGTKCFLFGGQLGGEFFDDLWVFDITSSASFSHRLGVSIHCLLCRPNEIGLGII